MMNLDDVIALANQLLLELGEVQPMLIALGSKGATRIPLEQIPEDRAQKAKLLLSVGYAVGRDPRLGELQQVFILFEGWMSSGSGPTPAVMPADDPNRQEILAITQYQHPSATTAMTVFRIRRSDQPESLELERVQETADPEVHVSSPLIEAFLYGYVEGSKAAG